MKGENNPYDLYVWVFSSLITLFNSSLPNMISQQRSLVHELCDCTSEAMRWACNLLHVEPCDQYPVSELVKESISNQSLPYTPDLLIASVAPHVWRDVSRTVYGGVRTTVTDLLPKLIGEKTWLSRQTLC